MWRAEELLYGAPCEREYDFNYVDSDKFSQINNKVKDIKRNKNITSVVVDVGNVSHFYPVKRCCNKLSNKTIHLVLGTQPLIQNDVGSRKKFLENLKTCIQITEQNNNVDFTLVHFPFTVKHVDYVISEIDKIEKHVIQESDYPIVVKLVPKEEATVYLEFFTQGCDKLASVFRMKKYDTHIPSGHALRSFDDFHILEIASGKDNVSIITCDEALREKKEEAIDPFFQTEKPTLLKWNNTQTGGDVFSLRTPTKSNSTVNETVTPERPVKQTKNESKFWRTVEDSDVFKEDRFRSIRKLLNMFIPNMLNRTNQSKLPPDRSNVRSWRQD